MGNRVEDLETQVAELQAAVDGLTEELVEAKERISQLERSTTVTEEPRRDPNPNAEFVPNESAASGSEGADGSATADEEEAAQAAARGADAEAAEESDSSDDDSDDIIVA